MFIISENDEYAVAVSAIEVLRIYDADNDSDFDLYANVGIGYTLNDKFYHSGYRIFSAKDKQTCIAIRDKIIARIQDRPKSGPIYVEKLVAELKTEETRTTNY